MANENLVVWTTDWHMASYDGEVTETGQLTYPTRGTAFVSYINNTLDPVGAIDTGDNKDHYGGPAGTSDEHDNWISIAGNNMPWLTVNAGDTNALYPNLPGNHDEFYDYDEVGTGNNDFSTTYDTKFWGAPYHWTADWDAARVRFIGVHAYIHHIGSAYGDEGPTSVDAPGYAHVDTAELAWMVNELNTLPERWQAIICSHYPICYAFGDQVNYLGDDFTYGTWPVHDELAERPFQVVCALAGHRHQNWNLAVQDGVTHMTAGGVSYGLGNGLETFVTITLEPADRTLTFDCRYATSPYARLSGFTPVSIQLQPHRLFFART